MSALQLGRIWASTPTSPNLDPGVDKYKLGWVAEIPVFQMLNFINNRYDTNIVSLAERGVFEWGSDVTYNLSAIVWDEADGAIYISKVASPSTTQRPGLNLDQWDKSSIQISRVQYDAAVAAWNNHIANTSNPHQLTTEILNTYAKSVIDGKVAVVQGGLNAHVSNTSNPHSVTATQVGAVPVTGGDYTGLVRHLFASTGIGAAGYAAKLFTDATGAFLALGTNSKLGLDNTNVAVFIDSSGVKSNLLLDSNYITAREAVEASYVPPTPDCEVILRNNISINYGAGAVTFVGPSGSRGYLDKSGTAQTAPINTPRFTAQGLYVTNLTDTESLSIPVALNLLNATNYTWLIDFQSTASTVFVGYVQNNGGSLTSNITVSAGSYYYTSVVGGVQTPFLIAAVNHNINHKVVVVSDSTQNKTFIYFDGVLKVTINSKQDYVSGTYFTLSNGAFAYGAQYLNSFKTWLSALTPQQVSNL